MMLRVFLIILTLFVLSFGKVEIKKDGAFAKVIIDEPQRGDFNFVLFHNNNPIVINCAGGKCIKKVRLKNGKNFFEWKNKEGLSSQSEIVGGYATLKILDCKNHHPINSGEVLVNGKSFQIHSGEVKVYRWMEKSVFIDPRIKDYTTNGKIKKKLKLGIVEEICLYPKEYTLKVYDCKNNRLINSGSLIINEDNFKIQNGIVKIHKWFGRDIEISPRVQNYTANGKITKIPEDKKIDKICLYPKEYTLKVYDCKNNRLINSGSLIINEDNFKIQNGIVKIHKWFGRDIEISPRVQNYTANGKITKIPEDKKIDKICLYPKEYTLKVYDCKNNRLINSGSLIINEDNFKIQNGIVKIHKWFGRDIEISPRVQNYTANGKITKIPEDKKIDKICLYPKEYTLKVYDCKNNRLINSGSLIINEDNFKIQNGIVKIHKWFGRDIEISPRVKGFITKGRIRKIPKAGKEDIICLYPMKKIKKAEGAIGDPRFNITWPPSPQDIDIHVKTPCGKEIYYASKNKKQICKGYVGKLDVDILRKDCKRRRVACQENITFDSGGPRGEYKIVIEKYSGTNTPTPVILTIINNGEKKVYEVNLTRVQEKKVFKIIH